ncbi:MAG: hypothetical protein HDR15_06245 [Lachnospiraceae bacterium]|nr:hypothetical protein [Lachnospiraceae bacterium]
MTKKAKGITYGVIGIAVLSAVFSSDKKVESIELSVPDYQIEYDINTKIPVDIALSPTDADAKSIEYFTSDDSITFSDDGILTGNVEGTFDVYVVADDVTSNVISINVVDISAREYAMAEAEAQQDNDEHSQDQAADEDVQTDTKQTAPEPEVPEIEESATDSQTSIEQPEKNAETNHQGSSEQPSVEEQPNAIPNEQQTPDTPRAQDTEPEPQVTVETPIPDAPVVQQSSEVNLPAEEPSNGGATDSSGNGSNFNTYDNASQQQTDSTYVLNTNTMKIHHPTCSSVPKIAPHNYATSNATLNELLAQGYSTCGICFK